MSKSMAVDSIMKIFLMIAVIIVGLSFLMKAFGIDVIEWLKDKLGGFGIPGSAHAIHVKADPDNKEIWEFHTVNSFPHLSEKPGGGDWEFYFFVNPNSAKGKCALLVTDENNVGPWESVLKNDPLAYSIGFVQGVALAIPTGGLSLTTTATQIALSKVDSEPAYATVFAPLLIKGTESDTGNIFFVNPGSAIQDGCTSLKDCVTNPQNVCFSGVSTDKSCNTCKFSVKETSTDKAGLSTTSCRSSTGYVDCNGQKLGVCGQPDINKNEVLNKLFREYTGTRGDCSDGKNCELLDIPGKDREHIDGLKIKYGAICDDSGIWRICKPDKNGEPDPTTALVLSKNIECNRMGANIFTWDTSSLQGVKPIAQLVSPINYQMVTTANLLWNPPTTEANCYEVSLVGEDLITGNALPTITRQVNEQIPIYAPDGITQLGTSTKSSVTIESNLLSPATVYDWSVKTSQDNCQKFGLPSETQHFVTASACSFAQSPCVFSASNVQSEDLAKKEASLNGASSLILFSSSPGIEYNGYYTYKHSETYKGMKVKKVQFVVDVTTKDTEINVFVNKPSGNELCHFTSKQGSKNKCEVDAGAIPSGNYNIQILSKKGKALITPVVRLLLQ